jgi:negative regulator of sigma E activity
VKSRDNEDYISSLLDGEPIDKEIKEEIERMTENDPAMRNTLRTLDWTRSAVRTAHTELRSAAPDEVRASVLAAVRQEAAKAGSTPRATAVETPSEPKLSFIESFIEFFWRYRLPFSGVAVAVLLVYIGVQYFVPVQKTSHGTTPDIQYIQMGRVNYREQSIRNFVALKEGKIAFHKETGSYVELEKFFREHGVDYDLIPPEFPAQLLGGVISEHNGHNMAHLVFKHGNDLIYMFQAPRNAFTTHTVDVEDTVLHIVDHGAWYWEKFSGSGTLAIWEKGTTLCAIVADLTPDHLQTLLKSKG